MTNKSEYELENLSRDLNLENNEDDPLVFNISPDLPDWVSKLAFSCTIFLQINQLHNMQI